MFHQLRPPQDVNEQPQKDPVFKVRLALAVAQYCCRMAACVKLAVGIESFLRSLTTMRRFLTAEARLKAMHRSSTYRYISHTLSYSPISLSSHGSSPVDQQMNTGRAQKALVQLVAVMTSRDQHPHVKALAADIPIKNQAAIRPALRLSATSCDSMPWNRRSALCALRRAWCPFHSSGGRG